MKVKISWKARLQNKTFWIALTSAVVLLAHQLGLNEYIPDNTLDIVNSLLVIGTILGIIVDPTTTGVSDSELVLNRNKTKK